MVRPGLLLAALAAPSAALAQSPPAKPPPPPRAVGEVVVTGQAAAPAQTSIDRRSYSVANDLQATSGSIGDALRNVPSLEVDVQGNVSLRGDPNVTILIDGKPSGLFRGEGKGQALQSLPADQVERVEVITNPSAEFRADGAAGVINLITRKAKGAGWTGGARLSAGSGDRVFGSASGGYNGRALSLTGEAYVRRDTQAYDELTRRAEADAAHGGLAATDQDLVGTNDVRLAGGRLAADYDLDARTRLSGEVTGQLFDFESDTVSGTTRRDAAGAVFQDFDRGVRVDQARQNLEVTAGFTRKFPGDGHKLTASLRYEDVNYDRARQGLTLSRIPPAPVAYERQVVFVDYQDIELKADYVRPSAGGATLKAGVDVIWYENTYDNHGFRGAAPAALVTDPALSNLFKFGQRITQAYVTYERPIGDLTVLAGLRLEDTRLDLDQATLGERTRRDELDAYPSLHLAWKLSDADQLSASYAKRIQRPAPDEYNAFRFLIDPVTYKSGNTDLRPQQTQSFELGLQHRKAGALYLATLYYRQNDKVVSDVTRDLGGGVLLITRDNVAATRAGGLELVANGRVSGALSYNASANIYWNEVAPGGVGGAPKRQTVTASGRASLNWQVTPSDLVQVSGFVNARRLTAQGYVDPAGMLNLGYRHKFSDRLSGVVTVQDALKTFHTREIVDTPALRTELSRRTDSRIVLVGLNWTFGGGKPRDTGFEFQQGGGAAPQ